MVTVASLQNLRNDLILKFSIGAAIFADQSAPTIQDPFDPTGGVLQPLPAGYQSAGLTTTDGITTTRAVTMVETMAWQSSEVQRSDVDTDKLTFGAKFLETNPVTQALFENQLLTGGPALGTRWVSERTEAQSQPLRRCLLLGYDVQNDVIAARFLPRVKVTAPAAVQWHKAAETQYDVTFDCYYDYTYGTSAKYFLGGAGWLALLPSGQIVLVITPGSVTLSLAGTKTSQLKVTANGTDETSTAAYTSSAPSVATVSAAGLVTGVAAGSAAITASYQGATQTCQVTVTA